MVSDLDAVEQIARGDPQTGRDLRDRRDPHVPDAALRPCQLDRMDPTTMGQFLLGQALFMPQPRNVATYDLFRLELPRHPRDALVLSRSRPEPMTFGSGMSPDNRRWPIFRQRPTSPTDGAQRPRRPSCAGPAPAPADPPRPARGHDAGQQARLILRLHRWAGLDPCHLAPRLAPLERKRDVDHPFATLERPLRPHHACRRDSARRIGPGRQPAAVRRPRRAFRAPARPRSGARSTAVPARPA